MTVINSKKHAVRFKESRHFSAHDRVAFPATEYSEGGNRCGLVRQEGGVYLVRLRENPHRAEWVTFGKSDG